MSRNIKEIGKELLGKSLNSYHRRTGLTQLEENNKMQDGILNGILSQVDDAYIEKTEQSNVIHLDGSGDGVVVLDSIEGNTMVNYNLENKIVTRTLSETGIQYRDFRVIGKPNTEYTAIINVTKNTTSGSNVFNWGIYIDGATRGNNNLCNGSTPFINVQRGKTGILMCKFTSRNYLDSNPCLVIGMHNDWQSSYEMEIKDIILLEGDYTNKEVNFFEGLQSSFEEKINDDGKYEIEILSNNKNLCKITEDYKLENANGLTLKYNKLGQYIEVNGTATSDLYLYNTTHNVYYDIEPLKAGTTYTCSLNIVGNVTSNSERSEIGYFSVNGNTIACRINNDKSITKIGNGEYSQYTPTWIRLNGGVTFSNCKIYLHLEKGVSISNYEPYKQNKIKILLDEPLRAIDDIKDRLCVKDGKLVVERKIKQVTYNGSENWVYQDATTSSNNYLIVSDIDVNSKLKVDKVPYLINVVTNTNHSIEGIGVKRVPDRVELVLNVLKSKLPSLNSNGIKNWISQNNLTVCYQLAEPTYEEVLNEYGEPIILEGYENGTIYIDSTIVPTTTVRYTPKMESFKTLNEVSDNNTMLANDINDNIIPYMMDVDFMIMEKEMALMSHKNIRKMEVLDMTSMQKRTQDMLERLIKGKTLTEQECKTRVTTYLNAGKITDAQAEELMLLISEVYA